MTSCLNDMGIDAERCFTVREHTPEIDGRDEGQNVCPAISTLVNSEAPKR